MAENEESKKHILRELWRVVVRRWRLFLLTALLTTLAVLGMAPRFATRLYTGDAKLERRTEVSVGTGSETTSSLQLRLQQDLAGRTAVQAALEELGKTRDLPRDSSGALSEDGTRQFQAMVQDVMSRVRVRFDVRSPDVDIVSVSYTDADAKLAEKLPNKLVENYTTKKLEDIIDGLELSRDFLADRVKECNVRVEKAMSDRTEFEKKYAGMSLGTPGSLQQQITAATGDIERLQRQKDVVQQQLEQLRRVSPPTTQADQSAPTVTEERNPERVRLAEQLRLAEDKLADARTMYHMKDNHPTIQLLEEQKLRLKKQLDATPEFVVMSKTTDPAGGISDFRDLQRMQIEMDIAAREVELRNLDRDLERKQAELARGQDLMKEYTTVYQEHIELVRLVEEAKAEANSWRGRLTQTDLALSAEVAKRRTHLQELELAEPQFRPSSPTLPKVLGFAVMGGLAVGGGAVFLAKMLDRSILTTEDAEQHFDIPVCGVVGEITTARDLRFRKIMRWGVWLPVWCTLAVLLFVLAVHVVLWLNHGETVYKDRPLAYILSKAQAVIQVVRDAL